MLLAMLLGAFPRVKTQLAGYRRRLEQTGGPLAEQGLASIRHKAFHCLGGSVYSFLAPTARRGAVLEFIVAFQTISDYLDNLCDRAGVRNIQAFRQLHTAMLDALDPKGERGDYYAAYPHQDDGGYLQLLVGDCHRSLREIPGWQPRRARKFMELYSDLQCYKHVDLAAGEKLLQAWHRSNHSLASGLHWWEFAAAAGSTLGVFALAADPTADSQLETAYMPWVNGLHILLDYYIDQEEDREHGDLNLVSYYADSGQLVQRLGMIYHRAKAEVKRLPRPGFHSLVLDGLLGLYLSDAKAAEACLGGQTRQLLALSPRARCLTALGRLARSSGWIN